MWNLFLTQFITFCSLQSATLLKDRLWHRCFFANFEEFLRIAFSQNTSGRLLPLLRSATAKTITLISLDGKYIVMIDSAFTRWWFAWWRIYFVSASSCVFLGSSNDFSSSHVIFTQVPLQWSSSKYNTFSSLTYSKRSCNITTLHCIKSVHIQSFSGPYFPPFGLNTGR